MRTNAVKQKLSLGVYCCVIWSITIIMTGAEVVSLKTCYSETILDCPPYSLCSLINATNPDDLKCICLQSFQLNPKWQETQNATGAETNYCIPSTTEAEENKMVMYMRSASNPHHLVFGILMVLLAVTLVTAALYGLKVLRPIKRTKAAYKRLKNRRQNITPLQEMDELEMNRRYEMETY